MRRSRRPGIPSGRRLVFRLPSRIPRDAGRRPSVVGRSPLSGWFPNRAVAEGPSQTLHVLGPRRKETEASSGALPPLCDGPSSASAVSLRSVPLRHPALPPFFDAPLQGLHSGTSLCRGRSLSAVDPGIGLRDCFGYLPARPSGLPTPVTSSQPGSQTLWPAEPCTMSRKFADPKPS